MSGGGSGSPSAFLGGQQIAISYCNINNVPPPKEIVDIPDYNALIELQNQLKREQLKNEERQRLLNNDGKSFTQKNNEFQSGNANKDSISGASGSTQAALAISIASGNSQGNGNSEVISAEGKSLTNALTTNGKLMPFINTEYTKKKNLLLQNFPARVSTPSKTTLQLLESNNSSNYRESFTDFTSQIRSNLYSRHLALTDYKDSGMLNINATQIIQTNPKIPVNNPQPFPKEEIQQQNQQQHQQQPHQIVLCKREGGGVQLALQKPLEKPLILPMKGSLSQNIIIGTKLSTGSNNNGQLNTGNNVSMDQQQVLDSLNSPGVRPFDEQNNPSPLKKIKIRANHNTQAPILTTTSQTPQAKSTQVIHMPVQSNLLPPLRKHPLHLGATGVSIQPPSQGLSKQTSQIIRTINAGAENPQPKSIRKQKEEQHGGDVARIGGGGFITTHTQPVTGSNSLIKSTSRQSISRGGSVAGNNSRNIPSTFGNGNKKKEEAEPSKPPPSPVKIQLSTTDVNKQQQINNQNQQSPDIKHTASPKQQDNRQHSILRKMVSEIQSNNNKTLNIRNNQSPFTAIKKEPLVNNSMIKPQYTVVRRGAMAAPSGAGTSPALLPQAKLTQESLRPRSKQGSLVPVGLTGQQTQSGISGSPNKKSIFQVHSKFSSGRRLSTLNVLEESRGGGQDTLTCATPDLQPSRTQAIAPQYFNRYISIDEQDGISSEESTISDDPEEFADRLKYLVRNEEAMEFSQYCVQWLQKKREKLIKNSFAANINGKRLGPNNISQYDHIGYCPDKTEPKWKKEVQFGQGATILPPSLLQRENLTTSQESTRASSAPTSDTNRDLPQIFRIIVKDELKIFDDNDIDFIVEQAQLKVYPQVLAKQWAIAEPRKGTTMYGKDMFIPNEIASQTKIMTAYVVMKMLEELEIEQPRNYYIRVTKKAEKIKGTKAGLIRGQLISIYDCLHALMLPSGNDAALTLATAFGKFLHFSSLTEKRKNVPRDADEEVKKTLIKHLSLPLKKYHEAANKLDNRMYIQSFVAEMNKHAKLLKLEETTQFTNPHGLADKNNHSTPADICRMASFAMKNPIFKEIVCRKFYECTVISREHNVNLLQWFNSNKLLNDFFLGIKTGTTPSAGPCLCGYFQYGDFCAIACVMNTKTTESRFRDMAILFLWALDKYMCGMTCSEPGNNSSNIIMPNWSQVNNAIAMKRKLKWTNFSTTIGSGGFNLNPGNVGNMQTQQMIQEEEHSLLSCADGVDNQETSPERKQSIEMCEESVKDV